MLKKQLVDKYFILLQDKIDLYQEMIDSLTEDARNDAKSSAGDKHETTLSKLHIEQEKIAFKLKEVISYKSDLEKIDLLKKSNRVILGSLVTTNNLIVFICIPMNNIAVEDKSIFGISANSPLGKELMGNQIGHRFLLNNVSYVITDID